MKKNDYIFFAGLILWIVETWAFGWNAEPSGIPEKMLDSISLAIATYGALCGLGSSIKTTITLQVGSLDAIKVQ